MNWMLKREFVIKIFLMLICTIAGIFLEITAVELIISTKTELSLLWVLLSHGAACLFFVFGFTPLLANRVKDEGVWMKVLFWCFAFFVPVFGLVFFIAMMPTAGQWNISEISFEGETLEAADLTHQRSSSSSIGQGATRARLNSQKLPVELRMKALLSLQNIPLHLSSAMLQDTLHSNQDDLRMLAFGMLDKQENNMTSRIHIELSRLAESTITPEERQISYQHLAELYMGLVEGGLVSGDLKAHAINQAFKYIELAIQYQINDPGLLILRSKILEIQGLYTEAEHSIDLAVENGYPYALALPYLIEFAFDNHDIDKVKELVRKGVKNQMPKLHMALELWLPKNPVLGV
jgi:hypothetical protein